MPRAGGNLRHRCEDAKRRIYQKRWLGLEWLAMCVAACGMEREGIAIAQQTQGAAEAEGTILALVHVQIVWGFFLYVC